MRKRGFRGKSSPWHTMTDEQKATCDRECERLEAEGCPVVELRYIPYCGPGSLGDLGAVALESLGHIECCILKDGRKAA